MEYKNIKKAIFLERKNRFIAEICINNKVELCHVKNTGRCKELLIKGASIYVQENDSKHRKTKYSLISILKGNRHINMDSQIPNYVAIEALKLNKISEIKDICFLKGEVKYKNSRFDIYFENKDNEKGFIEVKGVTLEENGITSFPDAPSERAVKHINELIEAKKEGYKCYILFIVQMKNVKYFKPNKETHLEFAEALKKAKSEGVKVIAYDCFVNENTIELRDSVKVKL